MVATPATSANVRNSPQLCLMCASELALIKWLKQYVHMADQVTDTKSGLKYFAHTDQMSSFKSDNKKGVLVRGTLGRPKDLFYSQILNQTF